MTDVQIVARIGARVDALGGTWMGGPLVAVGTELGFEGPYPWPFYMVGRGGVLGDVDPAELAAAMVFPSPALVRSAWEAGRAELTPEEGVQRFIDCAYSWASPALSPSPELERTAELLERLADAVDCTGAPLAGGWRAVPKPRGVPELAVWAINVLREQRCGIHATAVLAAGLSPLEAIMATEGERLAEMYGWERPFPDPDACRARKLPAEAATDQGVARSYAALDGTTLAELADLLESLQPAS
jgi:hypothetical protein